MRATQLIAVVVALSLVVGSLPAAATASTATPTVMQTTAADSSSDSGNSTQLRASTGQQLATVLAVTDDEVKSAVEQSAVNASFAAAAAEREQAALLASRAATLRDRATTIVADYRAATAAYENGTLSDSAYAQRVAVLTGQAATVRSGLAQVEQRARTISDAELDAAGYEQAATADARDQLQSLIGSSSRALFQQYTGERDGEFSLERERGGVRIEIESDDGELTRGFERAQPGNGSFVVSLQEARTTARNVLSTDVDGGWTLEEAERKQEYGTYRFEFSFSGPKYTGEAKVDVDGETGEIFEFEEELEPREREDETETDRELTISVVEGTAAPGAEIALRVTDGTDPVGNASVTINDADTGLTDADGRLTVTLPDTADVKIEATAGESDGEREFEFESAENVTENESQNDQNETESKDDETDDSESLSILVNSGDPAPGATVTLEVTGNGEAVTDAAVTINGEPVGQTDADGQLTVTLPDAEDVKIEATAGDSDGEREFEFDKEADDEEGDE